MHVFKFEGGETEWVVAADLDDAWAVYCETMGGVRSDYDGDELEVTQLPEDEPLSMWEHPSGELAEIGEDGARTVERPASERAAKEGRGFLGQTYC